MLEEPIPPLIDNSITDAQICTKNLDKIPVNSPITPTKR